MKTNRAMFLAAVFLLAPPAARGARAADAAAESPDWDARVTDVAGDVKIYLVGSDGEDAIEAKKDMPLSKGDRVVTGKDGRVELAFAAENALELGSGSVLNLLGIRKDDTLLGLDAGRFVAKVKKLLNRRYRIRTPTSVSAVRGTEFALEIVEEDEGVKTVVGVFDEGKLSVTSSQDESGEERFLEANQEADFVGGQPPGAPRKLDLLEHMRGRLESVRARRDERRKRFEKYAGQNREKLRENMRQRRGGIEKNRQERIDRIKKRGRLKMQDRGEDDDRDGPKQRRGGGGRRR